jgi:hypothetical protein
MGLVYSWIYKLLTFLNIKMKNISCLFIRYKNALNVLYVVIVLFAPFVFSYAADPAGVNLDVRIQNPLGGGVRTIPAFIESALNLVMMIGVPIVALAIIYAGFLFVTAQGNSTKLEEAKKTLMHVLIGAALLLGSWIIANAIQGTIEEIKRTS